MPFGHFHDSIAIVKKNGQRFENINASVQKNKIFHAAAHIPVEEGDIYERKLSNGLVERYEVLDAGYYDVRGSIGPHYQSDVRKLTKLSSSPSSNINVQVIGPNARFNYQSNDSSTNTSLTDSGGVFHDIRLALEQAISDQQESQNVQSLLDELQKAQGTSSFNSKYRQFISSVADHITIVAPFIPRLTELLVL
jgi:hypothetical protein